MQLGFSQIDAKDYQPVYIEEEIRELTALQEQIVSLANLEYLRKLDALRNEIVAKYEPLLPELPADVIEGAAEKVAQYAKELGAKESEYDDGFEYVGFWHLYYT